MLDLLSPHTGTIIGGVIGFASSIGILAVTRWWDRRGKLKIFCKRTNDENLCWGFHVDSYSVLSFLVPLNYELMNTSNTTRVIRDVQMLLYSKGKEVLRMKQIDRGTHTTTRGKEIVNTKEIAFGANNSSYSFVLPPRSIQKTRCEYMLISSTNKEQFDEIRIAYNNEKDRRIIKHLAWYSGDWKVREETVDQEWIEL